MQGKPITGRFLAARTAQQIAGLFGLGALAALGGWLAPLLPLPIPGPVCGLILLLLLLAVIPPLEGWIAPAADLLLRYLGLLIVPAAVGVFGYGDVIARHGVALLVILLVTTVLTGLISAHLFARARGA
jgi:holin-like protein